MRRVMFQSSILWLAVSSFGQTVCPRHIETPIYPVAAQGSRMQAKVTLKVAINGDGSVEKVEVIDNPADRANEVLQKSAIENMKLWTFEKPQSAPATRVIVYQYKFDSSLPMNDHQNPITRVNIDLPDRVTILSNEVAINPTASKKKKPR